MTSAPRKIRYSFFSAEDARDVEAMYPGSRINDTDCVLTSEQFAKVRFWQSNDVPFMRDFMGDSWYHVDASGRLRRTETNYA